MPKYIKQVINTKRVRTKPSATPRIEPIIQEGALPNYIELSGCAPVEAVVSSSKKRSKKTKKDK